MVFFYFGPSASSWAFGNDSFSACRELPPTIQTVWDSAGDGLPDKSQAGTRIDWISTGTDGSYCVMLKDGKILSNRNDLLQSIQACHQTQMYAVVDHVAFSPYGAYLIRLSSGHVMLSPEPAGHFPDAFIGLASDFLHFTGYMRYQLQPTQLEYVFFGAAAGVPGSGGTDVSILIKARGGAMRWQGLDERIVSELRALTVGVDMLSAGFQLGKRTALCPWDGGLYFLEFASFLGNTAKAYPYSLRLHGLRSETMRYVVVNERPPAEFITPTNQAIPPPPPPRSSRISLPPPPPLPPTPPATASPGVTSPKLPPRPQTQTPIAHNLPPPPPPPSAPPTMPRYNPSELPGGTISAAAAAQSSPAPSQAELPSSYRGSPTPAPFSAAAAAASEAPTDSTPSSDEERMDAFVNSLAMPADIRATAETLWTTMTEAFGDGGLYGGQPAQYLTVAQTMQILSASQLSPTDLAMIWEKSDLDHNNLMDREEFIQAVYLVAVQQYLRGVNVQYGLGERAAAAAELNKTFGPAGGASTTAASELGQENQQITRDASCTSAGTGQTSLRGAVKDIFKLFVDAGSQIGTSYSQNYQAANAAYQTQLEQNMQAINASYQESVTQQMAALNLMNQGANTSIAIDAAAAANTSAMAAASAAAYGGFGGGGNGFGTGTGGSDGDKDSKSGMAKQLRESLLSSIVTDNPNIHWEDVAGLGPAKDELQEAVVFPLRFPHMFQGKRKPRRAILLYGPPGTGKSYLAKAVATEVEYTLFSISATDLTSKWFGESELLVRQLFELAREKKPSVIFIDEIDALCNNRESGSGGGGSAGDDGTTARLKTEFLVQMDGVGKGDNDGVVLLAATNLPWSLDPAIRRRFQKRIHIPLPDADARLQLFQVHGGDEWKTAVGAHEAQIGAELARYSDGFSGSDVANAVQDALMLPVKKVRGATHFRQDPIRRDGFWVPCEAHDAGATPMTWKTVPGGKAREPPLQAEDFFAAVSKVKPSVGANEIQRCSEWTAQFGLEGA